MYDKQARLTRTFRQTEDRQGHFDKRYFDKQGTKQKQKVTVNRKGKREQKRHFDKRHLTIRHFDKRQFDKKHSDVQTSCRLPNGRAYFWVHIVSTESMKKSFFFNIFKLLLKLQLSWNDISWVA